MAEDTIDASIACRQIGPINIIGDIKDGERVFDERRSLDIQDSPSLSLLRPEAQCANLRRLQRSFHRRQPEEQHRQSPDHGLARAISLERTKDE
jgi:hypothetical protein